LNYYDNELKALKRSGRLRERKLFDNQLVDMASNDYLGFASDKTLLNKACKKMETLKEHAPKASMLVNGYHPIHQAFEAALCEANGFESGVIVGSGFSANIAMIEALVRKGDQLFMDELYHASGQLASKLVDGSVISFKHNDVKDLEKLLQNSQAKRKIIAIEGIYSMDGDLAAKEIFSLANRYDALLIIDEAHSSGVIGKSLMGILDFYDLKVEPNYIKMGTLGKAYGSFGAYILATEHIIEYLINRAKPIIYATAPSLFDTALGLEAFQKIQSESKLLKKEIEKRQACVADILGIKVDGLIVPVVIDDNRKVMEIQKELQKSGYLVGAIRQPTVSKAIIRLIARLDLSLKDLESCCKMLKKLKA
jgi:8-amino-7-oxononanoate synthase